MKQEYKIKEVFDEKSKPLEEKLKDIFISFLIEKINKQLKRLVYICFAYMNQPKFVNMS